MTQPEKFIDSNFPHHVLKLQKPLYGLKQSGRQWNFKLNKILKGIGFESSDANHKCILDTMEKR